MRHKLSCWLRRVQRFLTPYREPSLPQTLLPRPDLRALREELDPATRGACDGARNFPSAASTAHAEFEHDLVERLAGDINAAATDVGKVLDSIAAGSTPMDTQAALIVGRAEIDSSLSGLTLLADRRGNEWYLPETDVTEKVDEVAEFKAREGVTRPVREPESRVLLMAIVFVMVAAETGANGALFGLNLERGLLEGIVYAATLSIVNVGTAWLFGRMLIPYVNSASWLLQMFGWLSTGAFLGLTILINAAIANYRSALGISPDEAGELAITRMWSDPFGLTHLSDVMLFLVGLTFAVLACWEGYRFSDPLPGYGPLARALRRLQEDFVEATDEWVGEVKDARDEGIQTLKSALASVVLASKQAEFSRARQQDIIRQWNAYIADVHRVLRALTDEYRAANLAARTAPAPASFSAYATLPEPTLHVAPIEPWNPTRALEEFDASRMELNRLFLAAARTTPLVQQNHERRPHVARQEAPAA